MAAVRSVTMRMGTPGKSRLNWRAIGGLEGAAYGSLVDPRRLAVERRRQRHLHGMCLADVMHVEIEDRVDARDGDARIRHDGARLAAGLGEMAIEERPVEPVEPRLTVST